MNANRNGNTIVVILIALGVAITGAIGAGWYAYQLYSTPLNHDVVLPMNYDDLPLEKNINENSELDPASTTEEPISEQIPDANGNIESPIEFKDYPAAKDSLATVAAANQFAFELYGRYRNTDENVFFSPYSISSALQMTYEGARGKTAQEMAAVFHFPNDAATRIGSFAKLYEQINPQNASYRLSTANALWAQNDYPFDQNYLKTVETCYRGKATNLDFVSDTENSRQTINEWVSDKTAQKIPELFASESLNPLTRLVLTNAIYFKGKWEAPFEKMLTKEKDFTAPNGAKTKCQMMNMKESFGYAETAEYQVLELPYGNNDLSMIIILPQNGKMAPIESELSMGKFAAIKNDLKSELVDVFLPKFKFDASYNMNQTLAKMGMPTAFDDGNADFSGMYDKTKTTENLYIGLVIHKAYIDVYEEGTEAAAATGVAMQATAVMEPPQAKIFNADHPFMFAIVHNDTGSILFMGKVNDPNK